MLKLEIKLDDQKIVLDNKYDIVSIYHSLKLAFDKCQLRCEQKPDGTMTVFGCGNPKDYGAFGGIITSLKEKPWFMDYVTKWLWYNSDDGYDEDDFSVEDVLYYYKRQVSMA